MSDIKVYTVAYADGKPSAIFSTLEKAKMFEKELVESEHFGATITEYELDNSDTENNMRDVE